MTKWRMLVVVAILGVLVITYTMAELDKGYERFTHLLRETDYQALLKACRELPQRVAAGDLEAKTYVLRYNMSRVVWRRRPAPEAASFPKAVLDLDPVLVEINRDGRVWVALTVSPAREGVFAYPENYLAPRDSLGKVELIPGLWFWDDGYEPGVRPERVRLVDELIQEGKELQRSIGKGEPNCGN